jgi:hypothetical protein
MSERIGEGNGGEGRGREGVRQENYKPCWSVLANISGHELLVAGCS